MMVAFFVNYEETMSFRRD